MTGPRLAFSWLTVLPVGGPSTVDRGTGARAIAWVPVVGAVLGAVAAGLAWLLGAAGLDPLLVGFGVVAALALSTRGMHVDGLADTFDGLGCYGPPERARDVMKSGGCGPFGVAAIVISVGVQAVSFGVLVSADAWLALAVAVAAGRVAVVLACRRGVAAADDTGFGALVAGTQPIGVGAAWSAVVIAVSVWSTDSVWQGPLVVLLGLVASLAVAQHCIRRFGGLSGDVLGATIEIAVSVTAAGLTAGI
ncbi:adenosylcobinamide-GDP ribazoletransferase [Antrihabitans sp. YC2-6]|uniref:adenosylcobinamide-GDP ribazoletransferase n=1 Tax=Antrihabitans sp. YC2-6 TaxID=2799498 RepID=UPI0018F59AD2|nr:adenosylcobinamide-GDP ribazoletransferase [Antrihabitans sp. YC2-6]MBJ8344906.1 adenosylcobinamide-GDP ribazoletransferase [Antrihabitans sp. YC2-6]